MNIKPGVSRVRDHRSPGVPATVFVELSPPPPSENTSSEAESFRQWPRARSRAPRAAFRLPYTLLRYRRRPIATNRTPLDHKLPQTVMISPFDGLRSAPQRSTRIATPYSFPGLGPQDYRLREPLGGWSRVVSHSH